jgi:hypothetical protein
MSGDDVYTVTFGFRAVAHAGTESVGDAPITSLGPREQIALYRKLKRRGVACELVDLRLLLPEGTPTAGRPRPLTEQELRAIDELRFGPDYPIPKPAAFTLVVPDGVGQLVQGVDHDALYAEATRMHKDTRVWMRGRVVDKIARHGTTLADFSQEPDYEAKKGSVHNFADYPAFAALREAVAELLGVPAAHLMGELNHYYDGAQCGIGFHGDRTRAISKDPQHGDVYQGGFTAGVRLGPGADNFPLRYQWYHCKRAVGKMGELHLKRSDLYVMDAKAMGGDFLRSSIKTVRHAAGRHPKWAKLTGVMKKHGGGDWPKTRLYPKPRA